MKHRNEQWSKGGRRAPTAIQRSIDDRGRAIVMYPVILLLLVLIVMTPTTAFAATAKKVQPITFDQLRKAFNDATGRTRVVVLLSPT